MSIVSTHVKEKLASFSTLDTILLIIEILECLWYFLIASSADLKMSETLRDTSGQIHFQDLAL